MRRFAVVALVAFAMACSSAEAAVLMVPPGNRNVVQPPIPGASKERTREFKTTFDLKYDKIIDLFKTDRKLIEKIKKTAAVYDIAPIHMIGALVGEHTYNVGVYDTLQAYYIKAAAYAGEAFRFAYNGEKVDHFVARPQFAKCAAFTDSDRLWTCREDVWNEDFRGKTVDGESFPNNRFSAVFFQPFYAGQTFGLGQINPLTALMVTDMVHERSGYPKLDENHAADVYNAIMDPDMSLAYMAAIIRKSIDDYKTIAHMDISDNPGITATLYNLGETTARAKALAAKNSGGGPVVWPQENYYGWLVNDRLAQLQSLL
ncbi:DUF1402 family protein [Allorhizobium sonneratiae]|uniref:DUF1402 family protein n=1 Tax=Allorhizobium sonneratiae TaxID=2934936 RepID=UPI003B8468F7